MISQLTPVGIGIALVVGSVIGLLAAKIAHGTKSGPVADIAIGVVGALIGALIIPDTGSGHIDDLAGALIGAVVLLVVVRFAAPMLR